MAARYDKSRYDTIILELYFWRCNTIRFLSGNIFDDSILYDSWEGQIFCDMISTILGRAKYLGIWFAQFLDFFFTIRWIHKPRRSRFWKPKSRSVRDGNSRPETNRPDFFRSVNRPETNRLWKLGRFPVPRLTDLLEKVG